MRLQINKVAAVCRCILLLLLVAGLSSCSDRDAEPRGAATMVSFSVVAPSRIASRAATPPVPDPDGTDRWGDDYISDIGIGFDNLLKRDEFRVVITDAACRAVISMPENIYCIRTTVTDSIKYDFLGMIPKEDVAELRGYADAKIHVIANAGSLDNPSVSDIGDLRFVKSGKPGETLDAIPMWGVHTVNFTQLEGGRQYDAGAIWLLRAMAKVEIEIDKEISTPNVIAALNSVAVSGSNTVGWVLPGKWSGVGETTELRFDDTMRIPVQTTSTLAAVSSDKSDESKITFYMPETDNSAGRVVMTLSYVANGTEKTGSISFAEYNDGEATGQYYHIVRNHLYRFAVNQNGENASFRIRYTVCPMDEKEVDIPEFN